MILAYALKTFLQQWQIGWDGGNSFSESENSRPDDDDDYIIINSTQSFMHAKLLFDTSTQTIQSTQKLLLILFLLRNVISYHQFKNRSASGTSKLIEHDRINTDIINKFSQKQITSEDFHSLKGSIQPSTLISSAINIGVYNHQHWCIQPSTLVYTAINIGVYNYQHWCIQPSILVYTTINIGVYSHQHWCIQHTAINIGAYSHQYWCIQPSTLVYTALLQMNKRSTSRYVIIFC